MLSVIYAECHLAECRKWALYAECFMLNVIMLSVVAPLEQRMLAGYSQKLVRSSYDHFYDEKLLPVRIKHEI